MLSFLRGVKNTYILICGFDRCTFRCSFSDTSPNSPPLKRIVLSEVAQKAVLAALIIKTIRNAKLPKSVQYSLRDEVLSLQKYISSKYYDFDITDECKNQIFSIFDTGIDVRNRGYGQKRVIDAQIEGKVTFFPTYSVTKYIFDLILSPFSTNNILIGSDGIGKTFSYLLYSILSSKVNHLKFLATAPWIDKEERQKYKWEYNMLMEKQYIQKMRKIWYLNIQITQNRYQKDKSTYHLQVVNLMVNQLSEFCFPQSFIKDLKKCKSVAQFVEYLDQIGVNKSGSIIVLDQINQVTSLYWKLNRNINDEIAKGKSESQAIKTYIKTVFYAEWIQGLLSDIKCLGKRSILNSSIYLEQQIISRPTQAMKDYLIIKFQFYVYGDPTTEYIKHTGQMMKIQQIQIQFCQLFLFLIELYSRKTSVLKQNFDNIKKNIKLQKFIIKDYYQFLLIREYFDRTPHRNRLYRLTQSEVTGFIEEISKDFHQFCLSESKQKLKDYLQRGNNTQIISYRNFIVRVMSLEAKRCALRGEEKVTIPYDKLKRILTKYTNKHGKKLEQINIVELLTSSDYNSSIFPFNCDKDKKVVECIWPTLDCIQITDYALFSIDLRQKNLTMLEQFASLIQQDPKYAGMAGEGLIRQLINESHSVSFKLFQNIHKDQKYKTAKYDISGTVGFVPFNQGLQVNQIVTKNKDAQIKYGQRTVKLIASLQHNLKDILFKARSQPNQGFYGQPVTIEKKDDFQQVKYNNKGKCIDFLFVKYSNQQNIFDITTVDIAVQPRRARQKRILAEEMLKKLLNKVNKYKNIKQLSPNIQQRQEQNQKQTVYIEGNAQDQNKYRINHIILCPQEQCQSPKVVVEDVLTFSYYPIELVQFGCKNQLKLTIFHQALKIMPLITQR